MCIFLVRRLWRLVFNGHMESPILMRARVRGCSWGFHMFIFYLTTYGDTLILPYGIPNDYLCSGVRQLVGISYFLSS
jgi:hypothetical protein